MENKELKIVYKPIDSLIDTEYNPKKCTPKEENDIRNSIMEFGIVDPLIVNTYPSRENVIIGGHQRRRIAKSLGYTEVPCVEVYEDLEREKELNIRLSKNVAAVDELLLVQNFTQEMLERVGCPVANVEETASEFERQFNEVDNSSCVYPIVPKFSEKYDAVIIVSKNSIDTAYLETKLGIKTCQSYKNQRTGKAMIIDVDQFREQWEEK